MAVLYTTKAAFCTDNLFTDSVQCDDGSTTNERGCCAQNDGCPSTCRSWGYSISSDGKKTCRCAGCAMKRKLDLTQDQQFLKAHNYFRCRHGFDPFEWKSQMASNAKEVAVMNNQKCALEHSKSYELDPSSGENLAAGQSTPEGAVEAWYNEIADYTPGTTGTKLNFLL